MAPESHLFLLLEMGAGKSWCGRRLDFVHQDFVALAGED